MKTIELLAQEAEAEGFPMAYAIDALVLACWIAQRAMPNEDLRNRWLITFLERAAGIAANIRNDPFIVPERQRRTIQ